jgi:SAM-dependent methyltransferase
MPNEEQVRYWNEDGGPNWVANELRLDLMIAPFNAVLVEGADAQLGEHVLDVGSGFGTTSLELARAVGEQGRVMALDVSEAMMARLRSRAAAEAVSNIIPHVGDAQTEVLPAEHFRLVVSRFGVMFFDDPTAAFANIHEALRPDGRLVFVCWQALAANEWAAAPLAAMAPVIGPIDPTPAGRPGPFGLADGEVVHEVLDGAGFEDVELTSIERPVVMGGDEGLDAAVDHCAGTGPARRALAGLEPEQHDAALELLRQFLAERLVGERVTFDGAAWLVRARP